MFGSISGVEILVILVLALLLFGPRSLPKIGRTLGRTMSDFRRATHDFRTTLEREVRVDEVQEVQDGLKSIGREITEAVDDRGSAPSTPASRSTTGPEPPTPDDPESRQS